MAITNGDSDQPGRLAASPNRLFVKAGNSSNCLSCAQDLRGRRRDGRSSTFQNRAIVHINYRFAGL
jgi:hypothetical protein